MIDPLRILLGGFLLSVAWISLGVQVITPWRLVRGFETARRPWSLAAAPLGVVGVAAFVVWVALRPEALATAGILPWGQTLEARLLSVMMPALLIGDLVILFGGTKISGRAWGIPAALGLGTLAAFAALAERLRGDLPAAEGSLASGASGASGASTAIAVGVWVAIAIAAGQVIAPADRPRLPAFAALAVAPLYFWLLSPELRGEILGQGAIAPLAAGTFLGLSAVILRKNHLARVCAAAATFLLAIFYTWAAVLGDSLAERLPPMPPLPS